MAAIVRMVGRIVEDQHRGRLSRGRDGSRTRIIVRPRHSRLVWTNDESDDGAVTTVTFEERDGKTLLVMQELYPSKEALDNAFEGMEDAMPETFEQLDEFLVTQGARVGRS